MGKNLSREQMRQYQRERRAKMKRSSLFGESLVENTYEKMLASNPIALSRYRAMVSLEMV